MIAKKTNKGWRVIVILSLCANLCIAAVFLYKFGIGIIHKIDNQTNGGGDYHSNVYYDAYLSTFLLNDKQADIVFLGDSITLGGMWSEFFPDKNILNRGIASDTSAGVFHRLYEVESHIPEKIFLMIGCNDIARDIPLDEIIDNVEQIIIKMGQELPECVLFIQSILPSPLDKQTVESLNAAYKKMAEQYENCVYIDLYPLFLNEDGNQNTFLFSSDYVHLNGEGYKKWIEIISGFVYR